MGLYFTILIIDHWYVHIQMLLDMTVTCYRLFVQRRFKVVSTLKRNLKSQRIMIFESFKISYIEALF